MSNNPLAAKIAAPYARALYDFSVEQNIMHQITADFQNLEVFLSKTEDLTKYLTNPLINADKKHQGSLFIQKNFCIIMYSIYIFQN